MINFINMSIFYFWLVTHLHRIPTTMQICKKLFSDNFNRKPLGTILIMSDGGVRTTVTLNIYLKRGLNFFSDVS